MQLEWDERKAQLNLDKHGIAFDDAALVFFDSERIEACDTRQDYGEERWTTIGRVAGTVLFVVYTVRQANTIRLISARKANAKERQRYHRQAHA